MPVLKNRFHDTAQAPAIPGPTRTKLPETEVLQDLTLNLNGTVTVVEGGGKKHGTMVPEGILSLIRSVTIDGSSSTRKGFSKFKYADFAAFYRLQQFLEAFNSTITQPYAPGADFAVGAALPFSVSVPIDFQMPHSSDPRRTLLKASETTSLNLVLDWGRDMDLVTTGYDSTITFPTLSCKVSVREYTDGTFKDPKMQFGIHSFTFLEQAIAAANTRLLVDLKRGYLLRGFLIKCYTQAAGIFYHTPVDTILNSVALELNRDPVKYYDSWAELQDHNMKQYGMAARVPGYAFVDLMPDGRYDTIVDTRQFRDVNVVLNVNAIVNGIVRIYPVEMIPPNA